MKTSAERKAFLWIRSSKALMAAAPASLSFVFSAYMAILNSSINTIMNISDRGDIFRRARNF